MISIVPLYSMATRCMCLLLDKDYFCMCSERDQWVIKGFGILDSSHTQFPSITGKSLKYQCVNTHSIPVYINQHLKEREKLTRV